MILLFWTVIALAIFLWVALTYVLSGITELVSGMRSNKESLVTHGVRQIVVWLLIAIAGLYGGLLLISHLLSVKIKEYLPDDLL